MVELTRYRKTAPVRAVQVTWGNVEELCDNWRQIETRQGPYHYTDQGFGDSREVDQRTFVVVDTLEGEVKAPLGEEPYFCVGPNGDTWLVAADIFEDTYEEDPE